MNAEVYRWAEKEMKKFISAEELPMPPAQFVRVVHVLTERLLALRFLTPELITEEIIIASFEALASPPPRKSNKSVAGSSETKRR